jgi:hypothetical protein
LQLDAIWRIDSMRSVSMADFVCGIRFPPLIVVPVVPVSTPAGDCGLLPALACVSMRPWI